MDDTPQPEETPKLYLNEFFPQEKKIEIYNAEDEYIDMTGWVLLKNDGEEGEKDTFTIPATLAQIPAKGYAVFTCKQKDAANGPLFGLSGDKGFKIALKKGDTVIDEVNNLKEKDVALIVIPDGNSWGRETDGAADFVLFETPTIGAANTGAPEKPAPATIAEIVAAIPASANSSGAAVTIEAKLAAPAVVSYVNGRNAYIQDETGAILLYLDGHGLQPGDSILGEISVTACWFNGNPELTSLNILGEKTGGDAPQPKVITLAELLANFDANHLRLVKLMDVTVTDGIADGDRNGKISQGADEIAVYAQLNNKGLLLNQGDTGSLVTIPGKYNEKQQLYFWQNDWFSKQEEPAASGIKIDGDMSDWAMVMSTSNPNEDPAYAEFKVASDENNIYFYVRRTAKKFNDIWDGGGYVYFAFDTDNDSTTGTGEIFGNGPYETIFFIRPFAGNSSAPAFAEKPLSDSQIAPSGSLANYVGNGVFNAETGVELEFSIPRADLPAIPAGQEITIYSWGNKSGENMKDAPLKIAL
ncbi:MAG: hypothetical protein J6Y88_06790, partial [Bacteroidales bacterium]|nr:hypothetical protein [Bacteroidales bacterium]